MSGFDANRVYSVSVHDVPAATSPDSPSETEKLLFEFIQQFRLGGEFVYRYIIHYQCFFSQPLILCSDKLRGNILLKQHVLEVDLRHVSLYNDELAHAIQDRPADVLPLVNSYFSRQFFKSLTRFQSLRTRSLRLLV